MTWGKTLLAAALVCVANASAFATTAVNEVGALLVYPYIAVFTGQETFVTLTNTGPDDVNAHISFIDGFEGTPQNPNASYCQECNFSIALTPGDTEVIVLSKNDGGFTDIIKIDALEGDDNENEVGASVTCPWILGMLVVTLENDNEETLTDNVLLGTETVVDYLNGYAFSIPAIPFQGGVGNGDRAYQFDGQEYSSMPRIVAADFIAPSANFPLGPVTGELALFTLDFYRGFPPLTDCSVTGYDAYENPFSSSIQFGCYTLKSLTSISPEFAYPELGVDSVEPDSHGWFSLNCRVDRNPTEFDGFDAHGGVHGAIVQKYMSFFGQSQEPFDAAPSASTAWARLLYQSVTAGEPVTLEIESPGGSLIDPGLN